MSAVRRLLFQEVYLRKQERYYELKYLKNLLDIIISPNHYMVKLYI